MVEDLWKKLDEMETQVPGVWCGSWSEHSLLSADHQPSLSEEAQALASHCAMERKHQKYCKKVKKRRPRTWYTRNQAAITKRRRMRENDK